MRERELASPLNMVSPVTVDDLHLSPTTQQGLSCQKLCSDRVTEAEACRAEMDRIPEGKLVVQGGMSREIG